ncbi:MAG: hypothetical protein AAF391_07595 [Bacteroidota bacterium]
MDEVTLAEKSYQLVRKDLGLEEELVFEGIENAFDRLEEYLTRQVNYLLDHDLNKLMNALYRIDISEQKVKRLLHQSEQGKIALNLAKAIIEREKQKVLTRLKYQL